MKFLPSLLVIIIITGASVLFAQPVDVLPVRISEGAQSLNGAWTFKYIPSSDVNDDENFYQPLFNVSSWKTIPVPSHWELLGFTEPQYGDDVKEGTGLYRRSFTIPKDWQMQNRRVFLRFDGVLYGFTVYINGKQAGEWNSSYNQATFDITDALNAGIKENVVAVRVTTRSKGWNFDNMDCWALSGIYRDVTLFSLPKIHLRDYTAVTTLKPDGTADLQVKVVAAAPADVAVRLIAPDGKPAASSNIPVSSNGNGATVLTVSNPMLWTAETPSLYRLELDVVANGNIVQRYTDRVGLRQVTIEDGILKLNGAPIKLRGVNHHEIWLEGRVSTDENTRLDLELMRAAHINFIRTSHYPPHPRLLELCDEMGIYVADEVPYTHGRQHLKDTDYQENLYMRSRATVMRDKNRPCVIFWTLGNENPITELGLNNGRYVKQLDPSRPITFPTMGSYFDENWQKFPEFMDIYASHYPRMKTAAKYAKELDRPIIFTEYAHQRGIARSGTAVQDLWEIFYRNPRIAGGALWLFQDQGIFRTTNDMNSVENADLMVWIDERHYYDTHGYYAMDGIVYSDRTPQEDFWQVRKVYSPVQIAQGKLDANSGAQTFLLSVENRYDFRTLSGMTLRWSLRHNNSSIQSGDIALAAKPKQTETVSIPATLPENLSADVFTLSLQCVDESGKSIYERNIRLDTGLPANARLNELNASLPTSKPTLETTGVLITVRHSGYQIKLDRRSGQILLLDAGGKMIVSGFGPHVGRNPTINDMAKYRAREPVLWRGSLLRETNELITDARETADGVEITVSGNYPRPNVSTESVRGEYKMLVTQTGAIKISYDFTPLNASGEILEAGFALSLPKNHTELRWLGEGPFAGYSGKDRLNEYGIHHLNRNDLYFHGNRREVELISLAQSSGVGVLVCGTGMTIDLENLPDATILSHLALVPGENRNDEGKNDVDVSERFKAESIERFAGEFMFFPLGAQWGKPLTNWIGQPADRAEVTPSYFRSYDQ